MKRLTLIRHAKSSWKDGSLADIERPLNKRGIRNAPTMGAKLKARGERFDAIVSSPAVRAVTTAQMIAEEVGFDPEAITISSPLYTFNYEELLSCVRSLDDGLMSVAMVCHNPAVTDLTNFLALTHITNIPTCGVATLEFGQQSWSDAGAGTALLDEYDFPKSEVN